MKTKHLLFSLCVTMGMAAPVLTSAQKASAEPDTIYMNPAYANEVYYSLANGEQGSVNRKLWDIAFRCSTWSATILTNDGAGVSLYTYPKGDTAAWATFDTTGLTTWKPMFNSTSDWEMGAFNRNSGVHPDYGWCVYNAFTHNLTGDSLFLIKTRNGSFYKLWVVEKESALNKFKIKYANLDGSNEQTASIDCAPFTAKNFVGFSIQDNQVVDFEPVAANAWDILFTKYIYTYPDGVTTYPVTGVLSNYDLKVNRFHPVAPDFMNWDITTMDSARSTIGWDWKYLDEYYAYHVEDSLVFFVQDKNQDIFKLVFKDFAGSSSGRIVLEKERISLAGIGIVESAPIHVAVYPNPVSDEMNVVLNPGKSGQAAFTLTDLSGKTVLSASRQLQAQELNVMKFPVGDLPSGIYLLGVKTQDSAFTGKVIIK